MSWRAKLRKSSYNGAAFFIESSDPEIGRRVQVTEYPQRDDPYTEDMGRKARRFDIEAIVLGPDYMTARDALMRELEKPGPGTLVHHYLGEMRVRLLECRGPRESTREGGKASFRLSFIEAGEEPSPTQAPETGGEVTAAADAAQTAAKASFESKWGLGSGVTAIAADAAAMVKDVADSMGNIRTSVLGATEPLASLANSAKGLADAAATLIYLPGELADRIVSIAATVAAIPGTLSASLRSLSRASDIGSRLRALGSGQQMMSSTSTNAARANNQDALGSLVVQTAAISAARQVAAAEFESFQDGAAARTSLVALLDLAEDAASDEVYPALVALRAAAVRDIAARAGERPRLITYTPAQTLPAIVLAHLMHGDATRESDLVTRNRIRHPLFVPGGVPLEALDG